MRESKTEMGMKKKRERMNRILKLKLDYWSGFKAIINLLLFAACGERNDATRIVG